MKNGYNLFFTGLVVDGKPLNQSYGINKYIEDDRVTDIKTGYFNESFQITYGVYEHINNWT